MGTKQISAGALSSNLAQNAPAFYASGFNPEVGPTSNAYGLSSPYTYDQILQMTGGDPNRMMTVPFGGMRDQYAALATPFLGAAGAAYLAPAGAASGAASSGAAGATGAYDATAAGIDAGGLAGVGGAGSLASGMSGAAGGAAAGGSLAGGAAAGAGGGMASTAPTWLQGAGALAGGLAGLFGGSKQAGNVTTTSAPWAGVQPYMLNLFSGASGLAGQQPFGYGASPYTTAGEMGIAGNAANPFAPTNLANSQLASTIQGNYLNPSTNPYLASSVNDALGLAKSQIAGMYGGAAGQNINNSGFQENMARGLGAAATNAYLQNYSTERQNQLNSLQLAPTLQNANPQALMGVGQTEEQRALNQYNSPWQNLFNLQSTLGLGQGYPQSSQPYFTNPTASALGGAMAGAQIASGFKNMFGGGTNSGSVYGS